MAVISTEYGHDTTAAEVARGIDLGGRRIIVTGGASGIGVETARALAGTGAEVTLAVRDLTAGKRTAGEIIESTGNSGVRAEHLDLADRASVAAFVAAWSGPLHVLDQQRRRDGVSARRGRPRAGSCSSRPTISGTSRSRSALHDALAADGAGRIVAVSSAAHLPLAGRVRGHALRAARLRPAGWHTASPRRPTCCSQSRRRAAGPATASRPTR